MKSNLLASRSAGSPGVALVVTLMMMSVLTMMVVGLAGVMRNEQAAARNLTYQILADQLAGVGAQQGIAAVLTNSPTNSLGNPSSSGPGWLTGVGTNLVPLFATNQGKGLANVEEIGTNSLILGVKPGLRGRIEAGWAEVVAPGAAASNPLGRFTWWVDDEGAKINLNRVGGNSNGAACLRSMTPFRGAFLFLDPQTGSRSGADTNRGREIEGRTNYLFTTEALKDTNASGLGRTNTNTLVDASTYARIKGHVTAFSAGSDLTPWGTPKVSVNQTNTNLAVADLVAALNTNALTNVFGPGMTLARKFGGGLASSTNATAHGGLILQQIAANILGAMGRPVLLTNNTDYQSAFGNLDARRHRNGLPLRVGSMIPGPYLEEVRTRVDYSISGNGVGARVSFLVQVVNPYTNTFTNYSLRVQPRKFRFNVQAPANVTVVSGTSSAPLNGDTGPRYNNPIWAGPEWTAPTFIPWNLNSSFISNIPTIGPRSRTAHIFSCTINLTLSGPAQAIPQAYVILDQVGLYAAGGALTNALRDWLSFDDLCQQGNFFANNDNGQMNFIGAGGNPAPIGGGAVLPALTAASFGPGSSLGVRKIDPQVRWPLPFWNTVGNNVGLLAGGGWPATAQAWTRSLTMAQTLTNRFLGYLEPDPAPGVTDITNHPHFTPGYYVTNGITSVAQLGAIHTGIPWRTLRLQPQIVLERRAANNATNSPPDWIVLDLFTATNPLATDLPMLNVNSLTMAASPTNTLPAPVQWYSNRGSVGVPIRTWAVLGALAAFPTNVSPQVLASNGLPVTITTNLLVYETSLTNVASNLQTVLLSPTNLAGWSTNSDWYQLRRDNARTLLPNGLYLRGEILQVAGVAEDTNNALGEDVLEGRLRGGMDYLTTRSDTFSVWSVGQAVKLINNRTNVMSEVRRQTVFQRVPVFNGGAVTGYQTRILYTRNHVVE